MHDVDRGLVGQIFLFYLVLLLSAAPLVPRRHAPGGRDNPRMKERKGSRSRTIMGFGL